MIKRHFNFIINHSKFSSINWFFVLTVACNLFILKKVQNYVFIGYQIVFIWSILSSIYLFFFGNFYRQNYNKTDWKINTTFYISTIYLSFWILVILFTIIWM